MYVCSHVCSNISPNSAHTNTLMRAEVLALCSKHLLKDRRVLKHVFIYENAFMDTSRGLYFLLFSSNVTSITYYLLARGSWIRPWKRSSVKCFRKVPQTLSRVAASPSFTQRGRTCSREGPSSAEIALAGAECVAAHLQPGIPNGSIINITALLSPVRLLT